MTNDTTRSVRAPVVAVLEKDAFFRDFQRFLLSGQGFEVVAPEEPELFTADHIAAHEPSLVVTEIILPGRNGLDLVRELRERPELEGCAVVVFSVLQAEERAIAAGADRFVQKPLMRDGYLTTVTEMLTRTQDAHADAIEMTRKGA